MKHMIQVGMMILVAGSLLAACDDKKEGGGEGGDVPKICAEHLTKLEACIGKMPDAAKAPMKTALESAKKSYAAANSPAAKTALEAGCKASLEALAANPACK